MDQASTQPLESHQAEQARHNHLHVLYWALALLPFLYVLSYGPAVKLERLGLISGRLVKLDRLVLISGRPVEIIYRPVILMAETSTPFSNFLTWYVIRVWGCKWAVDYSP
jgi:hypothetical protein